MNEILKLIFVSALWSIILSTIEIKYYAIFALSSGIMLFYTGYLISKSERINITISKK